MQADQQESVARFIQLRDELQLLYSGTAAQYDPTSGGYLFPPHGMCPADAVLKMVTSFHYQLAAAERTIADLEQELRQYPYVPISLHPMIILQPNAAPSSSIQRRVPDARTDIIRKIGNATADRRMAQEGLDFWKSVRAASDEYMEELKGKFTEKAELRRRILARQGIALPAW